MFLRIKKNFATKLDGKQVPMCKNVGIL